MFRNVWEWEDECGISLIILTYLISIVILWSHTTVMNHLKTICNSFITLTYFYFQHIPEHIVAFVPSGVWVSIFRRSTNRAKALTDIHAQPFPLPHYSGNSDLTSDSQFYRHPSLESCGVHVIPWCAGTTVVTIYYVGLFSPSNSLRQFLLGCTIVRPSLRMPDTWR